MKKVVLVSLFAALATGCIITSGDDTNQNDVHITASWDIKSISGAEAGCPQGFDTAALYSQEIDDNDNNVGAVVVDLFDCTATSGVSGPLNPTTYNARIQIENRDGTSVYASSVDALAVNKVIDLTTMNKTFSADILTDGGYFELTWVLTVNGNPSPCSANTDVAGVEALSTEVNNASNAVTDIFKCSDHDGVTAGLPAGNYTVSVDALDGNNQPIGSAATVLTDKTVQSPNVVTNLGPVMIELN